MGLLKRIGHSPYLQLSSGLVLIGTALVEVLGLEHSTGVGAHHGVLFMGVAHILQSLPHVLEGAKELEEAHESLGSRPPASGED